jgi:hypothetical protein
MQPMQRKEDDHLVPPSPMSITSVMESPTAQSSPVAAVHCITPHLGEYLTVLSRNESTRRQYAADNGLHHQGPPEPYPHTTLHFPVQIGTDRRLGSPGEQHDDMLHASGLLDAAIPPELSEGRRRAPKGGMPPLENTRL